MARTVSWVTRGLDVLRQARRPGIRALCQVAGLTASEITAQDIGFGIAPRINAAGRMGDARDALDLLLCEDLGRAADLAAGLEAHNRARRAATDVAVEAAELSIGSKPGWFVHHISPDVALGVVGLVAGQLSRKYARPSIVLRQQGEWARGSLRSIPGFDVVAALDSASELLERYGGHAQAGGLTVRADRLPNLIEHLNRHAETVLSQRDLTPVLDIDSEVPIERIDWALQGALSSLEPCGEGNRKARLLVRNARVLSARIVGSNHLKLSLAGPSGPLGAIAFRQGEKRPNDGTMIDVVFSLGVDTWRGKSKLSLTVEDLATSGAPIEFESEMSSWTFGPRSSLAAMIAILVLGASIYAFPISSQQRVVTVSAQEELIISGLLDSGDDAGRNVLDSCRLSTTAEFMTLGRCPDEREVQNGFRFRNVMIPQLVSITSAHLFFTAEESEETGLSLVIDGEWSSEPLAFPEGPLPWPVDRVRTPSDVAWVVPLRPAWTAGREVRSPDIAPVVQDIFDLPTWREGNSVLIRVSSSGPSTGRTKHRLIRSVDHPEGGSARLELTYETRKAIWLPRLVRGER